MKSELLCTLFAAALLSGGCASENRIADEPEESGVMRFTAEMPQTTRATESAFEKNDRMGLFVVKYDAAGKVSPLQISGNHTNNMHTRFDGVAWESDKRIYWPETAVDVYAYYPYQTLTSVDEQLFRVALDQRTQREGDELGGYEASDLLWAKRTAVTHQENTPVALRFRHCMSKLSIRLVKGPEYEGALPDAATVYVHNTVPDAWVDLATGAVSKNSHGTPQTITCRKVSNELYEAIIVPQRLDTRRPFIELVTNGVSYLVEDLFNFRNGMHYTLTMTLNSDPGKISVEIGGSTGNGWN